MIKISEGLTYHLQNRIPLSENVYRPGSEKFFSLFCEVREMWKIGEYVIMNEAEQELLESDIGKLGIYNGKIVPLDFPFWDDTSLAEAKYKGREVTLGAKGAGRSGGRAYVYVYDPKSGNVKKISFGSSMPDAMGDSEADRKRRKSFGNRHGCSKNKDKLSASYWACRATKMFGRNIPGWW